MRIEQLEYVTAVTRFGSLRRASEQLHLSQPALSEAISRLEKELGLTLLDRRRSGARISRQGRELLGPMTEVLEAVARLRAAAGDQQAAAGLVRVGTVNTATATVLIPALRTLQEAHPATTVEVVDMMLPEIQVGLEEGTIDLGLINVLNGDDLPARLQASALQTGRPVVVLPAGHRYLDKASISVADLRAEPLVMMRSGYLMHRFANRLFGDELPRTCRSADGAEMGKLMTAEGLGLALLPDFSVAGDPMTRAGLIHTRPLEEDETVVTLLLVHRRGSRLPARVRELATMLAAQASLNADLSAQRADRTARTR